VAYQKVEREVTKLCEAVNARNKTVVAPTDVYNLAFDAHFGLVDIHPFADGNGRTSRLLMNYILAYHDLPLAVLYVEDRLQYYNALEQCRTDEETTQPLRDFLYRQQIKYFKEEIRLFRQGAEARLSPAFIRALEPAPAAQDRRQARNDAKKSQQ
jgi:Fic family protein